MPETKAKKKYRVLCWGACKVQGTPCSLSYPPDRDVFEGDVVDDIPKMSLRWLLDDGLIEEAPDDEEVTNSGDNTR